MSADNWTHCPRCTHAVRKAREDALAAANASYGKVEAEEYHRALDDARRMPKDWPEEPTFREDYDIDGVDEGKVEISYRGRCTACGLSVELKTEKEFWTEPEETSS